MSDSQLIGLRVETESGILVGRVHSLEIDTETQTIMGYEVKPLGIVRGLLRESLHITRNQVRVITDSAVIVENNIVEEKELHTPLTAPSFPAAPTPGSITSDMEKSVG